MLTDINSLNRNEIKKFEDYINSPYFNKYDTVKRLFYYLKKAYPNVTNSYISKKNISLIIYEDEKINNVKIRKLESDFNKLFQSFITIEEFKDQAGNSDIYFLNALSKKVLIKTYCKKLEEMKCYKKSDFGELENYFLNKFNFYCELGSSSDPKTDKEAFNYQINKIHYLNYYILYQALICNTEFCNNKVVYKKNISVPFNLIKEVHNFVFKNRVHICKFCPDIMAVYYMSLYYHTLDKKYFKLLRIFFSKNKNRLFQSTVVTYYKFAEICLYENMRIKKTLTNTLKLFNLRLEIIEKNYNNLHYKQGLMIGYTDYFYTFREAVNLKKFESAKTFAGCLLQYLPVKFKQQAEILTTAILNFFNGEFLNVFELLNKVDKKYTIHYIHSRYIKLMMLYETGNFISLTYEADSMRKYLNRKKPGVTFNNDLVKSSYVFIKYIYLLENLRSGKTNFNSAKVLKFKKELKSEYIIPNFKFWFKDKFKELERIKSR